MVDSDFGTLFVVSTPIGNMGDFSFRAIDTLKGVVLILAEDTRQTRRLLDHYDIATRAVAYHQHNEASLVPRIVEQLKSGDNIALVSDAGTPLISDPGERLVAAAVASGVRVVPIPGASAIVAALAGSGLAPVPFTFHGFAPRKGKERRLFLEAINRSLHTCIIFEAANRVAATLGELALANPSRQCVVAREITKKFEEFKRGTVGECAEYYMSHEARGEVVLLLAGSEVVPASEDDLREQVKVLRDKGLGNREIVRTLVEEHGAPRNTIYRLTQE